MGLCREGAEDVEHPTAFLLKAHGHVVELVDSCINLLLPRLEVVQHTGRIHRIVTRLAMDLDGAGDVAHGLVDVPDRAHYHVIEHFVPGQCALDCDFGIFLTSCSTPFAKVRMSKPWLRVGLPAEGPESPFGPMEPSTRGSVRPRFGSGAVALSVDVLFSFDREKRGSLGGSCFDFSPFSKRSDRVPQPPASEGGGAAPAEGAKRGVASSPPVGMVKSLAMATVASFVCSDAIFGVPISTETRHRFSFYELREPRFMRQFLTCLEVRSKPQIGSSFSAVIYDWCDTKPTI
jgi:hypothetical protein